MGPTFPLGPKPGQIGFVVPNVDAAMADLRVTSGLVPWMLNTMSAARAVSWEYRGAPGTFSMRAALCGDDPQIELIEPLDGPSIYHEWVAECGWGMHHFGFFIHDIEARIAEMGALGFPVIQQGRGYGAAGDGGYAYFDTRRRLGTLVEAIERPRDRRPPDAWWPAPPAA
jgi:methylmalonyl-CoA/ethylmalonyl-CoA epimerase